VVDEKKFDELVENTTKYLQMIMDKNAALEKRIAALEAKKPTIKRAAKDDG
jgi:BMFP domain-containing protein YqiC